MSLSKLEYKELISDYIEEIHKNISPEELFEIMQLFMEQTYFNKISTLFFFSSEEKEKLMDVLTDKNYNTSKEAHRNINR